MIKIDFLIELGIKSLSFETEEQREHFESFYLADVEPIDYDCYEEFDSETGLWIYALELIR